MAIVYPTRYPGRWNGPTADYPNGSFKNRSTPSSADGSFIESAWANDFVGFFSRLLGEAGITADNSVDTALNSQYYDALIQIINNSAPDSIGSIEMFATQVVPDKRLKANGAAISRTTFSELFTKIGTTFGAGDGSSTFNVPDLRGEFLRGWDDGRGIDTGRIFGSTQKGSGAGVDETGTSAPLAGAVSSIPISPGDPDLAAERVGVDRAPGSEYPDTAIVFAQGDFFGTFYGVMRPRNTALMATIRYE